MTKRQTRTFRGGEIIDITEHHDGNYGAPGKKRIKRDKPTREAVQKVNRMNKTQRCRWKMLTYINPGDLFATLTYRVKDRPASMLVAKEHFRKMIRNVRKEAKKRGCEIFWFRNIEHGTKGAWHIHLVINETGGMADILRESWPYGGIYIETIKLNDKLYDEDFTRLAAYMTKDERTEGLRSDGTPAKPRIREASYSASRNMPLTDPETEKLIRWKSEPLIKKGYFVTRIHEGINPVTGYKYRRYTLFKLHRERSYHADNKNFYPVSDRRPPESYGQVRVCDREPHGRGHPDAGRDRMLKGRKRKPPDCRGSSPGPGKDTPRGSDHDHHR